MLTLPTPLFIQRAETLSTTPRMFDPATSSFESSRRTSIDTNFGFSDTDNSTSLASTPCSLDSSADFRPDCDVGRNGEKAESPDVGNAEWSSASGPAADYSFAADQLRRQINMQHLVAGNRLRLRGAKCRPVNSLKLQPIVEVKTPQQLSGPLTSSNQDKTRGSSPRLLLARGIGSVQMALSNCSGGPESNQGLTNRQQSSKITPFSGPLRPQDAGDAEAYDFTTTSTTSKADSDTYSTSACDVARTGKSLVLAGVVLGGTSTGHPFDTVAVSFWLAELLNGCLLASVKEGGGRYGKARRYSVKVEASGEIMLSWKVRGVLGYVQHKCELISTKAVDISCFELQLHTSEAVLYVQAPTREAFEVWTVGMASIFAYCKTLSAKRRHELTKRMNDPQSVMQKAARRDKKGLRSLMVVPTNTV